MAEPALTLRAHAKVNLDLRVLGLLPDGYHEVRTVLQSLRLHDTLTFARAPGPFVIDCDDPAIPTDHRNLIWRAADVLGQAAAPSGPRRSGDLHVRVVKRIPGPGGTGRGQRRRRRDAAGPDSRSGVSRLDVVDLARLGLPAGGRRAVLPGWRHRAGRRPGRRRLAAGRTAADLGGGRHAAVRRLDPRRLRLVRPRRPAPGDPRRPRGRASDRGRPGPPNCATTWRRPSSAATRPSAGWCAR